MSAGKLIFISMLPGAAVVDALRESSHAAKAFEDFGSKASEWSEDSGEPPPEWCQPEEFVNFTMDLKPLPWFGASIRSAAESACKATWGYTHVTEEAATKSEAKWIQEECIKGVRIGHALCKQETDSGPSIAPEAIIFHHEKQRLPWFWDRVRKMACAGGERPQYTGFSDCHHACQFFHPDCSQVSAFNFCRVCADAKWKCEGVRKVDREYDEMPPKGFSFYDACIGGCKTYVKAKQAKTDGPACKLGPWRAMALRTTARHECEGKGGMLEDWDKEGTMLFCACGGERPYCQGPTGLPSKIELKHEHNGCVQRYWGKRKIGFKMTQETIEKRFKCLTEDEYEEVLES